MKRRTEHLVEKRDGRREFLRATKLARSIHLALYEIGVDEDWRALELATVVLEGLRSRRSRDAAEQPVSAEGKLVLNTSEIADAVQHLLVVTGQPAAAVSYGAVQAERSRRRQSVATLAPPTGASTTQAASLADPLAGPLAARKSSAGSDAPGARDPLGGRWAGEG
jgi:hypothetical protein